MEWYWILLIAWLACLVGFVLGALYRAQFKPSQEWQHSFLTGMVSIFHEGETAYRRGFEMPKNPYVPGTPERRAWELGYSWAEQRQ